MFNNPIIQRYRFSQFRPQQFWTFGTLYICSLLLIFFINISVYNLGQVFGSLQELYKTLFIQLTIIQVILLWLLMPMNCSNVVPREIADKSFDFFRMLPLSADKKTIGILVGRNLFNILIATLNLCIWLILGILGEISIRFLLQWFLLLVTGTLLLNSISLLLSVLSYQNKKSVSVPVLVIVAIFAFGPILGVIGDAVEDGEVTDFLVNFLNFQVPILYLISAYILIGTVWAFIGILRRFSFEYEPLFSRKGALGFMICFLFLVYALYHKYLLNVENDNANFLFYSFYFITSLPLLGICLLSIRSFDKYIETTRLSFKKDGVFWKIFLNSNLFLCFSLALLWGLSTGIVSIVTGFSPDYCKLTMLFFTAWLIIFSLVEIYAIYLPNNEKIGYLLIFIAGLYLILPMILSGLFNNDYLSMFSPFGIIYGYETYHDIDEILLPFIINIIFLIPLFLLIGIRYSKIGKLRYHIDAIV